MVMTSPLQPLRLGATCAKYARNLLPPYRKKVRANEGQQVLAPTGFARAEQQVGLVDAVNRAIVRHPCKAGKPPMHHFAAASHDGVPFNVRLLPSRLEAIARSALAHGRNGPVPRRRC
jgi:hypothetical protein